MKPFLKLKSVDEILKLIAGFDCLESESVPLGASLGRRLSSAFFAPSDLPGFARTTVDGYAVRARDVFGASEGSPALLRLTGGTVMGKKPDIQVGEGEAVAVFTGGMLPEGADCAAMVEYSRMAPGGMLEITRSQAPGDNVVAYNEDAGRGSELMPAGHLIRPQEIGCFAAFGIKEIGVVRIPKVAIISTGDEIAPIEADISAPMIRDVNSHSLAALCGYAGVRPLQMGICPDDQDMLARRLELALEDADVILVSGGSSAGSRDHTLAAFMRMPEPALLAHGAAISPGKPFILAKSGKKPLLGMPGHVSSALICGRVFLLPLLERLQGCLAPPPVATVPARLTRSIASTPGRRDYIRCRLARSEDGYEATPVTLASAVISGLVQADGLLVCPENREGFDAGEVVAIQPI